MSPPHLLFEGARHGLRVEFAPFRSDHDLEREVQQEIAQLIAQLGGLAVLERLIELERFFDQVGAQRLARLGVVPGTTRAQIADQRERAGDGGVGGRRVHEGKVKGANLFFTLHLAIAARSFRAPVNASPSGRDARAWVEVDLAAIVENARAVARVAGTRLLPVVKANAYGVGAVAVSKALEPLAPWGYGVATVDERAEVRGAGITRPVLVFMPARPDLFGAYRAHRLTPALGDEASIHAWIARGAGGGAFHLEIDTGMSRSGVRWDEIEPIADLVDTPYLEGCYTHFHSADQRDGSADRKSVV